LVVEKDGSVTIEEVLQSPDRLLTEAAEKAIKKAPKFEPGKQRGVPVRVAFTLPVVFKL
jgi:protein TonB